MHNQPVPQHPSETVAILIIPRRWGIVTVTAAALLAVNILVGLTAYNQFNNSSQVDNHRSEEAVAPTPIVLTSIEEIGNPTDAKRFEVSSDGDPAIGPQDAPITIIEFSDFQCLSCGQFARETLHPLLAAYEGQIHFVYRDYPILGNLSKQAAMAAECANDQDAFGEYHDLLFENQNNLTREVFSHFAESLQLDMEKFTACLEDPATQDEVKEDFKDARQLGIRGTPTFFINGRILIGTQALTVFSTIINEELATAK